MIRTICMVVVTALLAVSSAAAQRGPCERPSAPLSDAERAHLQESVAELHSQLRGYVTAEVVPQLVEWKELLDASLELDDLARLNELRAEAAELRRSRIDHVNNIRRAHPDGIDERTSQRHMEFRRQGRAAARAIMSETRQLAEKYREQLELIGAEARPQIGEWRAGVMAIRDEWLAANAQLIEGRPARMHHAPMRFLKDLGPMLGSCDMAVRFMLWSGPERSSDAARPELLWLPDIE